MKNEIINTLKDLLSFKTFASNLEEFTKCFNYIKEKYSNLFLTEYCFNNRKALVLSNTKEFDLDIIFCTHIDVVYTDDYSFSEDEENIYGRGTIDMKGSVSVCLTLFKHINTTQKIALFITSDEEIDGHCCKELLQIYHSKLAIVPDGGSNFTLITEEKGLLQLEISLTTKPAHAAEIWNGNNAITELIKIYEKLIQKYPIPQNSQEYITSINLSKLNGGISNNQVPAAASMVLDIRHISQDKKSDFLTIIKQSNPQVKIKTILAGPPFQTDLNSYHLNRYLKVCQKILNRPIKQIGCATTSDAIYFSEQKIPTIIMNPDGNYAHCKEEYVNKDSLYTLYQIYQTFIKEEENDIK